VPLLPPEVAAILGTTFELGMPVFLVLGLGARFAALPLLGMACIIQFVLGANNPDYDNVEHFYWMFLLAMIVVRGAGTLSLDCGSATASSCVVNRRTNPTRHPRACPRVQGLGTL